MKRQIAYDEQDLIDLFKWIADRMSYIETSLELMEEQAAGFRKNLDWKSSSEQLRMNLEKLKEAINHFHVVELPEKRYLQRLESCFSEKHLNEIKARYDKIMSEELY